MLQLPSRIKVSNRMKYGWTITPDPWMNNLSTKESHSYIQRKKSGKNCLCLLEHFTYSWVSCVTFHLTTCIELQTDGRKPKLHWCSKKNNGEIAWLPFSLNAPSVNVSQSTKLLTAFFVLFFVLSHFPAPASRRMHFSPFVRSKYWMGKEIINKTF